MREECEMQRKREKERVDVEGADKRRRRRSDVEEG